jgi:hypothetical protein
VAKEEGVRKKQTREAGKQTTVRCEQPLKFNAKDENLFGEGNQRTNA